jgi:ligand-binding sensor domain-containing protein
VPDGRWWLGTPRGVLRLDAPGRWALDGEQPGPLEGSVAGLAVVGRTLWVGTAGGLWARGADGWQPHAPGPPERPGVRAVAAAGEAGDLWVACEDRLVRYVPAARAVRAAYTPQNSGLGSTRVEGLAESGGVLWVATRAGITRFQVS